MLTVHSWDWYYHLHFVHEELHILLCIPPEADPEIDTSSSSLFGKWSKELPGGASENEIGKERTL